MENKGDNLPVVQDKNKMISTKMEKNALDFAKRAGKVTLKCAIAVAGFGTVMITGGISALTFPICAGSAIIGASGLSNLMFKDEPSLLFNTTKSKDGTREIYQQAFKIPSYLRDNISIMDKGNIMGLQTLVGFERYKTNFKIDGKPTFEENGKNVYEPKYSTLTHSVNINNLRALSQAGYIDILSEEENVYRNSVEEQFSFLGFKKRPYRSLLIIEKLGFSNKPALRQIFEKAKSGDKEGLDKLRQDFKNITFRLTDKPIDFEDIYMKVNGYKPYESPEEEMGLKKLRSIFFGEDKRIPGILSNKMLIRENGHDIIKNRERKFDIKYDRFGRPVLDYNAEKSFGQKIDEKYKAVMLQQEKKKEFEEEMKRGIDLDKLNEVEKETSISKEDLIQSPEER